VSSPLDVNGLFVWLNTAFGWTLPVQPLRGVLAKFNALWDLLLAGPVPVDEPFPWIIAVEGSWNPPVGGTIVLSNIEIRIGEAASPPSFAGRMRDLAASAVKAARPKRRKRKQTRRGASLSCRDPATRAC